MDLNERYNATLLRIWSRVHAGFLEAFAPLDVDETLALISSRKEVILNEIRNSKRRRCTEELEDLENLRLDLMRGHDAHSILRFGYAWSMMDDEIFLNLLPSLVIAHDPTFPFSSDFDVWYTPLSKKTCLEVAKKKLSLKQVKVLRRFVCLKTLTGDFLIEVWENLWQKGA